ncbi:BTAD domain-containing putative transcriptional regulator [Lentzea sp. DG1S-22]|uniref:AfsR/SARP family transcriptional regulator n=1 Tax=Lentzea sp. DG1S-22 TaxID=3108822 RepID=UPI002E7A2C85|nr:BTAD domain-containing putative transcriptional regulator [Lentzea sp. DG1S-22]WVH82089.1 BTAD domain-containing putative transcriptional regulator [Lentzea sp. DG1S-22]
MGKNRQLNVLALLLINVGKLVPVGRLIDAVWGASPPATVEKQIQTCVWRLRRAFEAAGAPADIIETGQGGYRLHLAGGVLDAQLFEEHVRRGRARVEAGDLAGATSNYSEALALFEGAPLAEFTSGPVQAVAAHWEERRLAVLEEQLDIQLAMGQHAELVSELKMLVAEYPLREQLRAQLMTALYLSHRRADALAVYRSGRAMLINSLGLEPGARLQELHRRIIAGTPVPPTPHQRGRRVAKSPAQLPLDVGDFTGRWEELEWLTGLLSQDSARPQVVSLVGRTGIGKTALALHAAHRVRNWFPDGQLYADLRGSAASPASPMEILQSFLHALGMSDQWISDDLTSRAAQFRSAIAGRQILIVLDDVPDAASVEPLLPGGKDAVVVATGQVGLMELPGVVSRRLDDLETDDAVQLLARIIGTERVEQERGAARTIAGLCGRLPLALRAAGARLHARPQLRLDRFVERLADENRRLAELSYGSLDLAARLDVAADRLPPRTRTLWLMLSLPDLVHIPAWAATAVATLSDSEAQRDLDLLVDHQALDIAGEGVGGGACYVFHPLVRIHARRLAHAELDHQTRTRAMARLADAGRELQDYANHLLENRIPAQMTSHVEGHVGHWTLRKVADQPLAWLDQEGSNIAALARAGQCRGVIPDNDQVGHHVHSA